MKATILGLFLIMIGATGSFAQSSTTEQEIINLSKEKWQWMADKNVDELNKLFHEKAMFVHMGGSWEKNRNSMSSKAVESGTRKRISMKYR